MVCFEDLPNELFYEIFDYLDGYQLYESFMNLNTHFQKLLLSPCIFLRMNLYSKHDLVLEHAYENIINPNKSRIISLRLANTLAMKYFWRLIMIDSLFSRLQSLVINDVSEKKLLPLLIQCASLPRLYSLTISLVGKWNSFNNICQVVFHLPFLKYLKLSHALCSTHVTLPFATDQPFNSIEYLNLDIRTNLNDLLIILSYIPQLRHLTCHHLYDQDLNIRIAEAIVPPHLTHIYLDRCHLPFVLLEIFIETFGLQLRVLRVTTSKNVTLLDADLWERLILQYAPNLEKIHLEYEEKIPSSFQLGLHHQQISRFTSSFWTKRRWYLQLEMDGPIFVENRITYKIHSFRSRDEKRLLGRYVKLTTSECSDVERYRVFLQTSRSLFCLVPITSLNMNLACLSAELLMDFISHLPHLHSLSLSGLASLELNNPVVNQNNKITKVRLKKMTQVREVHFLIHLCPRLEYLQVGCTCTIDMACLLRCIKLNYTSKLLLNLRALCLHVPIADEKMIKELQSIIALEKLFDNYLIIRIMDKIFLRWK